MPRHTGTASVQREAWHSMKQIYDWSREDLAFICVHPGNSLRTWILLLFGHVEYQPAALHDLVMGDVKAVKLQAIQFDLFHIDISRPLVDG